MIRERDENTRIQGSLCEGQMVKEGRTQLEIMPQGRTGRTPRPGVLRKNFSETVAKSVLLIAYFLLIALAQIWTT